MWMIKGIVIYAVAVLLFGASVRAEMLAGRVVAIADGDTLTVLVEHTQHKVRLAEIDAPERRQAFGTQSRQSLAELCFEADATVAVTTRDRYGRSIARVTCNGTDASLHQVQTGMAWAYTRYLTDPAIARAEQAAREARAGLWADSDPVPPWLFRRTR